MKKLVAVLLLLIPWFFLILVVLILRIRLFEWALSIAEDAKVDPMWTGFLSRITKVGPYERNK